MKKLLMALVVVVITISMGLSQRTVSGTIADDTGIPLIGVNVIEEGTSNGTITDIDGSFSLNVSDLAETLLVSYTGFTSQEIDISGGLSDVLVTMAEGAILDEVVVTALGISKDEKSVGYAVQKLASEDISKTQEANLINSLSGRIAGVQINNSNGAVGASSRITLRGVTSLTGSNDPLFIVDGVFIDNSTYGTASSNNASDIGAGSSGGFDLPNGVAEINPAEIEDITVLKGPNAAALYGVRAANGVIVITTKSGGNTKGLGISLTSSTTWENPLVIPDFQNSYGQGGDATFFEWIDGQNGDGGIDESWGPPLDVGLEFLQFDRVLNGDVPSPWVSQPDNVRNFYETGVTSNNNLSITGGNETTNFRLSLGRFNQTGIVPNTNLERYSIGGKASTKVAEKLTVDLGVNFIKSGSDNLVTQGYNNENPVQQTIWSGRQVDFEPLRDYESLPLAGDATAAAGTPLNWNTLFQNNPYWVLNTNLNTMDKTRVIGNAGLTYDITDNIFVKTTVGVDTWSNLTTERKAIGSNEFAEGYYREINRNFSEVNSMALVGYKDNAGGDFDFSLNIGASRMDRNHDRLIGEAPQLELPDLYTLANVKSGVSTVLTSFHEESRINSVLGFGQLSYRDMIYLDFSARNDWASVLPEQNNSFFYPSLTLSAVVTEMLGMTSNNILSFAKIRGGWSKVGSIGALSPYSLTNNFAFRSDSFGTIPRIFNPNTLNNPNIKPETTTGVEIGADVRLFNNRLYADVTLYDQVSEDLIVPVEVSASSGFIFSFDNIGEMRNRGVEVQLGGTIFETEDFYVSAGLNFAKNINEVVSLGGLDALTLGGQWNMSLEAREGLPYGVIFGPGYLKDDNGSIIHIDGVPQIDPEYQILGDVQPDWTGGVNFSVGYKSLVLKSLFDARQGSDIYSMTTTWGRYAGVLSETLLGRETGIIGDGVMPAGDGTYVTNNVVVSSETYNKAAYSNSVAEGSVFDASFVKWRELSLTYSLPNKIGGHKIFNGASISLIGRNLAILSRNTPHIDPETAFSSENAEQGQEFGQLPSTRSIGFNLNFNF